MVNGFQESAYRAGHCESLLANVLRHWPGQDRGRFWVSGRNAIAPRIARLAGHRIHSDRMERQESTTPDCYIIHLPPVVGFESHAPRERSRKPIDRAGFAFPDTLEGWATPQWQQLSMRRGDGIPWMDGGVRRRVRNFERVINAYYPTVTDARLTGWHRAALKAASAWRSGGIPASGLKPTGHSVSAASR